MTENEIFESYSFDNLNHGKQLKIEHTVYLKEPDMSYLISKPLETLQAMRKESAAKENFAYVDVINAARSWETEAVVTSELDRAIEYLKIPETEHSSNKWVKGKDELAFNRISNRVYKMSYRIYERSSWRNETKKYDVTWDIYTNSPRRNYNIRIAGQDKTYSSKADAEKYIQGRMKAYSHLFTEISLPIPKEYENPFKFYSQLLPGYITEEMQKEQEAEKPSIKKQLTTLKTQEKNTPPQEQGKTRSAPEL